MKESKRLVFLVDMNSFFISCEKTRHPEIVGKPAAVAGNPKNRTGIILTANYEARKFGVKTAMVVHEAIKLCPKLQLIPPDHDFYKEKSNEVMNILSSYTPILQENSIDEAWLDMTGTEGIFGKPVDTARQIMNHINSELGLWCSIGIAENKFLSKMASEFKKPLGISELWKEDLDKKLWPLPVRRMYGIGKQTAEKINSLGILTIGDLAHFDKAILYKKLGKLGVQFYELANGRDDSPVDPHKHSQVKSIGRSTTLSQDITDLEEARVILMELADQVGITARNHGIKGHVIQIVIKYANFESITRQTTVSQTNTSKQIYSTGYELLKNNWNSSRPVRLIGISLSGFDEASEVKQISMFESPQMNTRGIVDKKQEKLENTLDAIKHKHGDSVINRASLLHRLGKD